jgi:tight adherence protein C
VIAVLLVGIVAVALVPIVAVLAFVNHDPERAGVTRSLSAIEKGYSAAFDVARNRPLSERIGRPLLDRLGRLGTALTPNGAVTRLERQLDYAGNPAAWPVERVVAAKGVGLVVIGAMGSAFGLLLGGGPALVLSTMFGAAFGFFGPDLMIYNIGVKRQDDMRKSLPDVLDTLTISVEA